MSEVRNLIWPMTFLPLQHFVFIQDQNRCFERQTDVLISRFELEHFKMHFLRAFDLSFVLFVDSTDNRIRRR